MQQNTARHGVIGGGQLGCDYQIGSWVFGLQGLVDLSGMKGSDVLPNAILVNNSYIQTVATITGRIGYTVLPTLLLYGKAGGAYTHSLYDISVPNGEDVPFLVGTITPAPAGVPSAIVPACAGGFGPCQIALGSKSVGGWTAGFGAEWAFAHAPVSVFLEYDYLGMRSADVPLTSAIVPGLVFPINVSSEGPHSPVRDESSFRERTLRFQKAEQPAVSCATRNGLAITSRAGVDRYAAARAPQAATPLQCQAVK